MPVQTLPAPTGQRYFGGDDSNIANGPGVRCQHPWVSHIHWGKLYIIYIPLVNRCCPKKDLFAVSLFAHLPAECHCNACLNHSPGVSGIHICVLCIDISTTCIRAEQPSRPLRTCVDWWRTFARHGILIPVVCVLVQLMAAAASMATGQLDSHCHSRFFSRSECCERYARSGSSQ